MCCDIKGTFSATWQRAAYRGSHYVNQPTGSAGRTVLLRFGGFLYNRVKNIDAEVYCTATISLLFEIMVKNQG